MIALMVLRENPSGKRPAEDRMVPPVGFELTAYRLQGGCSTTELQGLYPRHYETSVAILRKARRDTVLGLPSLPMPLPRHNGCCSAALS